VIAIIGVLAALIVPAMGAAREGARRAQCANNLRQHGVAWHLYMDDHNGCFPRAAGENPTNDSQCNYGSFGGKVGTGEETPVANRPINRYLDIYDDASPALKIFQCPDDTIPRYGKTWFDAWGTSYEMNNLLLGLSSPYSLSKIRVPLDQLLLEVDNRFLMPGHGGQGWDNWPRIPVMVLFVDGHVKGPFLYSGDWGTKVLEDPKF
jgi:prepilin-type processing-associated H-X9-DG protein